MRDEFLEILKKNREDDRFNKLHKSIDDLIVFESFEKNFKSAIMQLNNLFDWDLVDQIVYDDYIHILNGQVLFYLYKGGKEVLVYHCCICNKYFLENEGLYFQEEIRTKLDLSDYSSSGFCSKKCYEKTKSKGK